MTWCGKVCGISNSNQFDADLGWASSKKPCVCGRTAPTLRGWLETVRRETWRRLLRRLGQLPSKLRGGSKQGAGDRPRTGTERPIGDVRASGLDVDWSRTGIAAKIALDPANTNAIGELVLMLQAAGYSRESRGMNQPCY